MDSSTIRSGVAAMVAAFVVVGGVTAPSLAEDLLPAPFRGQAGATHQAWEFSTPNPDPLPDGPCPVQNPAGVPMAHVSPGSMWLPNYSGLPGVWCLVNPGEFIGFDVPNPGGPPFKLKTVWIQMTLHFHTTSGDIQVSIVPGGLPPGAFSWRVDLPVPGKGPGWVHRTETYCLPECPPFENIILTCVGPNPDDHVDVGEVVIETNCEPDICDRPPPPVFPGDYDGDGRPDTRDNAPGVFNPNQSDCDDDGIGDVSDTCEICDPMAPPKGEPCGLDFNGGCTTPGEPMTPIGCNEQYCGDLWADAGSRDTDWFQIDVPDHDGDGRADVIVEVCTSLPVVVFVMDDDCLLTTWGLLEADLDRPASMTLCLAAPRTYRIFVAPGTLAGPIFNGFPCDMFQNEYWIQVWCAEPCGVCGVAGGNSCCLPSPNGTPGCEIGECCAKVCAVDPFCCQSWWDGTCADQAGMLCHDECCVADVNGDGIVDGIDLALVLGGWGATYLPPADLNRDCIVDGIDLALVLGGWGPC